MKAEAVRPPSQDKIAHGGKPRESEPLEHGGERRESEPPEHGGERRESEPLGNGGERRESEPPEHGDESGELTSSARRDRRDSRWDEHRRARREQLVDAALSAVSKHGAGVGMEEIAAEAGTSKTVVYRHFADRADLHVAVCNRVAEQLLTKLRVAMETSARPRQMTTAAIDTYLAFLEADPEVYRFVVGGHSGHFGPHGAAGPIDRLSDLVGEQAAALMAVALDQAGQDPAAAGAWGHGLVGLVRSAADWWLRAQQPMPRGELAAHLTDLAWTGLSGVVAPAPPSKEDT
ncbi:TetR family transcriptional regulator [Blastococcus mobilis]|uniref:Transcriptional regulator, TetR family n=1 Tax=Blastococcus mobilis TaxID=1938746 RepID=A0A238WIY5_9ACTN|nr:TetR family transcriptional regulator [Blastococcus mobilis]SNR46408.1 transcriptional regulator, TetR family [Blastococcus mobilis]